MTTGTMRDGQGLGLWRLLMWGAIVALVAAPAVAMRLGAEGVFWTTTDFVFAAAVLGGAGVLFEFAAWQVRDFRGRVLAALAIGAVVVMIWAWAVN